MPMAFMREKFCVPEGIHRDTLYYREQSVVCLGVLRVAVCCVLCVCVLCAVWVAGYPATQ